MAGKVLMIVHDVYQDDNEFPLGVGYIAACLEQYGAEVTVCCQDVYHYSNEELAEKFLIGKEYDLICLGFMAARFKETVLPLCNIINLHKGKALLLLGGHGPSPIPEYILRATQADIVAIGEAEETVLDVLDAIIKDRMLGSVEGIVYRQGETTITNKPRNPVQYLDALPFPAWHLFPMDIYTTNMKYMGQDDNEKAFQIVTSRGCVNQCTFCYRMRKGFRTRSMDNVMAEIKYLYDTYGVTYFVIQDDMFVASGKRFAEFIYCLQECGLLGKIKYNLSGGIRANVVTEDMAARLKETGCCKVNIGFESTSEECLDDYTKHVTVQENIRAAELLHKYEITIGLNFIFGAPHDTIETLKKDAEFIKKYTDYKELRTIRPVTPYPGCDLYYRAIKEGLLKDTDDFFDKFKNSDLVTVNFTELPIHIIYKELFNVNKDLILDYYEHTTGNIYDAHKVIHSFYQLYFFGDISFRGPRHFAKKEE